jgi:hypothetical protein
VSAEEQEEESGVSFVAIRHLELAILTDFRRKSDPADGKISSKSGFLTDKSESWQEHQLITSLKVSKTFNF